MGSGPYMQGGYPPAGYGDPYATLQPSGSNPMGASAPSKTMKPTAGPIAPMKPHRE